MRPFDVVALQGSPLLGALCANRYVDRHLLLLMTTVLVANVLLVTHVFVLNDWSGLSTDSADPNKAGRVFTARGLNRRNVGVLTMVALGASLAMFAFLGALTFALAAAIASLSALYSLGRLNWKGKPLLSSVAHLAGGMLHFLLGYSVAHAVDARGMVIGVFFALMFAAGHLTQETRDYAADAAAEIRTNAVVFGPHATFTAGLILFALAHAALVLLALGGMLPRALALVAGLYPVHVYWSFEAFHGGLTYRTVSRLQTRYRSLYAIIGVAIAVALLSRR